MKLIGPFSQIVTLSGLPLKGKIADEQLLVIPKGGVIVNTNGHILDIGDYQTLRKTNPTLLQEKIEEECVLIPGFVDCHTHICFGGSRAADYAMRVAGKSYLEIANSGGGIWNSVTQTRLATEDELFENTLQRAQKLARNGVTTIEVKSGYGLSIASEIKILRAIKKAKEYFRRRTNIDIISTCLAAHMKPRDFDGDQKEYLDLLITELFPIIKAENLSQRMDIFVEESAFDVQHADYFLGQAKLAGFELTVHADQFSTGGSALAIKHGAISADHLEASGEREIMPLSESDTVAVVLPGASIGLGMNFSPARKLLNAGACVAISTDWNPGSAPMGDLLTQACILGAFEKLSLAETLAGLTYRAAKALALKDRGVLEVGKLADMQAYPCKDYREIFYNQGQLKPLKVWKKGSQI